MSAIETKQVQAAGPAGGGGNAGQGVWAVVRDLFRQRSFVVAVAVLLVAALGLNASVQFLQLHFKKQPVPMRQSFKDAMPEIIGTWVQVARDEHLTHDLVEALGTKDFLFCSYVNAAKLGRSPEDVRRQFASMTLIDQKKAVFNMQVNPAQADAVLSLGLTYYTGSADSVPHIPERCYLADGYKIAQVGSPAWPIDGRAIESRFVTFENTDVHEAPPCHVAYFFHVNGRYEGDSLSVRGSLQNLLVRHGYFAKIELRSDTRDRARAEQAMRAFLGGALPGVEAALPDWAAYRDRS